MAAKCGDVGKEIVKKSYGTNEEIGKKCEDLNKGKTRDCEYVRKKFGFSRVLWVIKNSCIAPPLKGKIFRVSEFYVRGFHLTRWEMSLERSYNEETRRYEIYFCLKRLECEPFYGNAVADCFLEYWDHTGEKIDDYFNHTFGVHMNIDVKIFMPSAGIIPPVDYHMPQFKLKLEILVHFEDLKETIPHCENLGIRRLSEDLGHLYDNGNGVDLDFTLVRNKILKVHKAILVSRIKNEDFKSLINTGTPEIDLEEFYVENVEKVIKFLYTGNLSYAVVPDPSIAVFKFAEYLNVKPITAYYNPEEITFFSDTDVEEFSATWIIEDFCSRDDYFRQSPIMANKMMDSKWQIRVYPNVFRNGVYLDILLVYEITASKHICVEFFLLGGPKGRISYRCHEKINSDGKIETYKFIKLDDVLNNYMRDDSLTLGFKLLMSNDQDNPPVCVERKVDCTYLSEQKYYDHLSDDISVLRGNKKYLDLHIDLRRPVGQTIPDVSWACTDDHNIKLSVNDCILEVRWHNLLYSLKNNPGYFNNISLTVLFQIIYFLYSGKLDKNFLLLDNFGLYRLAETFTYPHLKEIIEEKLQEILSRENAQEIYQFALEQGIQSLSDSALNFIDRF